MTKAKRENPLSGATLDTNELRLFGTYNILHPQYISIDFDEFKAIPFEHRIDDLLEKIPVHMSIVVCRRHPELLVYFLRFFNRSQKITKNPKIYLPFLCQWINKVPIQWIISHIQRILDVRYAYLLVSAAFSSHSIIDNDSYLSSQNHAQTWEKYRLLVPTVPNPTPHEAWAKLVDLRTSIIELRDLKLTVPVSLAEYLRFDKKGFMKNFMFGCSSNSKLIQFIKTYAIGYCHSNSINIDDLIIETVVRRSWEVSKKLSILTNFLQDQTKLASALERMTFLNDQELEMIKEYAKSNKIPFTTDPNNYIQSIISPRASKIVRSNSNDNISTNDSITSPKSITKLKRCPSAGTIDIHDKIFYGSVITLANGTPSEPSAYALKLDKFKDMEEIKPIYELAAEYSVVISYEHYCLDEEKRKLFIDLVSQHGHQSFDNIAKLLALDNETIIDIVWSSSCFKENVIEISPHLSHYLSRSNWELTINYIQSCTDKIDIDSSCNIWINALEASTKFADGIKLVEIANSISILKGILKIPNKKKNDLFQLYKDGSNFDDAKNYIIKAKLNAYFDLVILEESKIIEKDLIKQYLLSNNIDQLSLAIQSIAYLKSNENAQILIPLVNEIKGTDFSLLMLVYHLLLLNHMNYQKEISILSILFNANLDTINFHALMKQPLSVLCNTVTTDNLYEIISLSSLLEVNSDKVILHLMIKKMRSTNFDDYSSFISLLTHKKSLQPMIEELSPRFKSLNLIHFFEALGETQKVHEIRSQEILSLKEFQEQEKERYKTNPSVMVCELYSSTKLQEKIGINLHEKIKNLANLNKLSIDKIREHLVNLWLTDENPVHIEPTKSVFIETKEELQMNEDSTNVQRCMFILRLWPIRTAVKWLILFIFESKSFRSCSKAFECLFLLADETTISSIFTGSFSELVKKQNFVFHCRNLELANVKASEEMFRSSEIKTTINNLSLQINQYGVARVIFDLMVQNNINDPELALIVLKKLFEFHKHFLLININMFIRKLQFQNNASIVGMLIQIISAPFTELINKELHMQRFKAHHMSVFRETLDAFSDSPIVLTSLQINGAFLRLPQVIEEMAEKGWANLGSEFGSHVSDKNTRDEILTVLLTNSHFDLAFQFGFNESAICTIICEKELIEDATKVMVDASFITFTNWLHVNKNPDALDLVTQTLRKQGRVQEINRLTERLKKIIV